jgi:hypothetical protein
MKHQLRSALAMAALSVGASAFSYETSTHAILTQMAIERSIIGTNPKLFTNFGFQSFNNLRGVMYGGRVPTRVNLGTANDAIIWGSYWEDTVSPPGDTLFGSVAYRHFFDPQVDQPDGIGRGLNIGGVTLGSRSPDWILEYRSADQDQFYSFQKAQQNLKLALTLAEEHQREEALGMVLQSLGHIVHHVQDMAQPQHTRNEQHLHGIKLLGLIPVNTPQRMYEEYTALHVDSRLRDQLLNAWPQYPVPSLKTTSDYWFNSGPNRFIGMADFTARNFLAMDFGYSVLADGTIVSSAAGALPLPNGRNFDGTPKRIDVGTTLIKALGGLQFPVPVYSIYGSFHDGYTGQDTIDQPLAVESAIFKGLPNRPVRYFQWNDTTVWENGYKTLFPRAVAFSAGLINHFFRGGVTLTRASGNTNWAISNPSPYLMSGTYTVYKDSSTDGFRIPLPDGTFSLTLAAGASANVSFQQPPQNTSNLTVVFEGDINNEIHRVTGTVVPFTWIPQTCTPPDVLQNGQCVPPPATTACLGPYEDTPVRHNFGTNLPRIRETPNSSYIENTLDLGGKPNSTVNVSIWLQDASVYAFNQAQYNSLIANPFPAGSPPSVPLATMSETVSILYNGQELTSRTVSGAGTHTFSFPWNPPAGGSTKVTVRERFNWYEARTFANEVPAAVKQVSCPDGSLDTNRNLTTVILGQRGPRAAVAGCGQWSFSVDNRSPVDAQANFTAISGTKVFVQGRFDDTRGPTHCQTGFESAVPFYRINSIQTDFVNPQVLSIP